VTGVVKNPEVVCTELEDGAVLLNMETRLYYSLNDSGLEIWRLLDIPGTSEELGRRLTERLEVDEAVAAEAAAAFVGELERERLVIAADGSEAVTSLAAEPEAGGERRRFSAPELILHDEPLHEVTTSPFDPQLPLAE
jgi:Coenzyme PQQ synthesis protein D (PqqD)